MREREILFMCLPVYSFHQAPVAANAPPHSNQFLLNLDFHYMPVFIEKVLPKLPQLVDHKKEKRTFLKHMIHFFNVSVSWLNEVLGLLELAYILSPCVVFLNMTAEKQFFSFRFRQGGKRTIIEQTKRKKCCQNTKIRVSLVWTNDNNQMHYPQKGASFYLLWKKRSTGSYLLTPL